MFAKLSASPDLNDMLSAKISLFTEMIKYKKLVPYSIYHVKELFFEVI